MRVTKIDTDKGTLTLDFSSKSGRKPAESARRFATAVERLLRDRNPGVGATEINDVEALVKAINVIGDNGA